MKQMLPFFILMGVLWLMAEFIENTLGERRTEIVAPPANATATPGPSGP